MSASGTAEPSPTGSPVDISTASQPTAAPHHSNDLSAAIGAGVGVPFGVGLIAAFFYVWFRRRRQRRRLEEEEQKREETVQWDSRVAEYRQVIASEPQEMDTRLKTRTYSKPELSDDARRDISEVAEGREQQQ